MKLEFDKLITVEEYLQTSNNSSEFTTLLDEAIGEILFYDWCLDIQEKYIGIYYEGIVGVFLFKITSNLEYVDNWVWVIVGDLPPLYITCEDSPNSACALDSYIGAMEEWISAVERGESVEGLAPVDVPATIEYAKKLKVRLKFLDEKILSKFKEDLQ